MHSLSLSPFFVYDLVLDCVLVEDEVDVVVVLEDVVDVDPVVVDVSDFSSVSSINHFDESRSSLAEVSIGDAPGGEEADADILVLALIMILNVY